MKLAVDVGAHTKGGKSAQPSSEGELWKRAFWFVPPLFISLVLIASPCRCCWAFDYRYSITMGRSPTLRDEELVYHYYFKTA